MVGVSAPTQQSFRGELRRWLDAISSISRSVNSGAPLEDLLDLIAATTCDLAGYDFSAIFMPDDDGTFLLIRGSHGLSTDYVRELNARRSPAVGVTGAGEAPTSRALRSQRPVALPDIWIDASCAPFEAIVHDEGIRGLLSVPLITSRGAVGALNCYRREAHDFTAEDIVFMETIANQGALAIEAATLRATERLTIERLNAANQQLAEQESLLRRAEHAHRLMTRLVLEDRELGDLVGTVAEITSCAVLVEDPQGRCLARSDDRAEGLVRRLALPVPSPDGPDEPGADDEADPSAADPGVDPGARVRVDEVTERESGTLIGLAAPVMLDGQLAGRIWAVGSADQRPSEFEKRVLERAAMTVALILSRQRIAQEVAWRAARDLVDDLVLGGGETDPSGIAARARRFDLDLDGSHHLLVVNRQPNARAVATDAGMQDDVGARSLLSRIHGFIEAQLPQAVVTGRGNEVIVLVPTAAIREPVTALARRLLQHASDLTGQSNVRVAISEECAGVADYPGAYGTAQQALALTPEQPGDGVVDVRNLGFYRVLLTATRPEELARFSREVLGKLADYDARRGADLIPTVRTYLRTDCSVKDAAEALVVHPNTVRYRLRRVEDLLEISLANEADRLQLNLALMIASLHPDGGLSPDPTHSRRS